MNLIYNVYLECSCIIFS